MVALKGNAVSEETLERARFAEKISEARLEAVRKSAAVAQARISMAQARVAQAAAELKTYLAGPWQPDVTKAQVLVNEASSRVARLRIEIERQTGRSPLDASMIRLNLREGEFAQIVNAQAETAPVVLGDLKSMHVRVDIDEFDAQRFKKTMKAVAYLKGGFGNKIALEFIRVEPFIVPKRAVTNSQREIVDTRVLRAIYRIADPAASVYIGQQLDVFIDAATTHG